MNNRHHANLPVVDASNGTGCCRTVLYCTSSGSSTKALSRQCNGPISFHYLSARDLFARMFKLLASKVSVSHRSVSAPQNTVRMKNFSPSCLPTMEFDDGWHWSTDEICSYICCRQSATSIDRQTRLASATTEGNWPEAPVRFRCKSEDHLLDINNLLKLS